MRVHMANQSSSIDTNDILDYYNKGHTIKECGLYFSMHPETIRMRFRKAGVADCRKKSKDIPHELVEYYKSGKTLKECGDKYGLSAAFISKKLSELGVKRSRSQTNEVIGSKSKKMWKNKDYRTRVMKQNQWDESRRDAASRATTEKWQSEHYREAVSSGMKERWADDEFRRAMIEKFNSDEHRAHISAKSKDAVDDNTRQKISNRMKKQWEDCRYKENMAVVRSSQPSISSIQKILYSILDDLSISYEIEYVIGPYSFDCMIPLRDKKLLIECQGDYWHSMDRSVHLDQSKATYIENYHPDCELKYLWEHEFNEQHRIIDLIKYWTNKIELEIIDFCFDDVEIRECQSKDYKPLLSKYHYLPNAGRGGMAHGAFGAYIEDVLVAVCVFAPLSRQNMPYDYESTRELSRLCIHPRYQKKNFASWFVSRCIKKLDPKYKIIISYCDTTFNHDGALYKACNFQLDGKVKADYWYVSADGWVMHKKTLYNHARKMSMKESGYAERYGYKRIYGKDKLRFVYIR